MFRVQKIKLGYERRRDGGESGRRTFLGKGGCGRMKPIFFVNSFACSLYSSLYPPSMKYFRFLPTLFSMFTIFSNSKLRKKNSKFNAIEIKPVNWMRIYFTEKTGVFKGYLQPLLWFSLCLMKHSLQFEMIRWPAKSW